LRCTSGFGGRSDNMVKLRGINVYPTAVAAFLSRWSEANGEYLCVVERLAGRDHMTIQVEWGTAHDGTTSDGVAAELSTLLGVSVDVTLCAPEATAELTGIYARQKPKRLLDNRND